MANTDRPNLLTMLDLAHVLGQDTSDRLVEDFIMARISGEHDVDLMKYPCRIDGYCVLYCVKGEAVVEVNLKQFPVSANTLVVYTPGNIIRAEEKAGSDAEFVLVAGSVDFVSGARLDFSKLYEDSMALLDNPCIQLDPDEFKVFGQYWSLTRNLFRMTLPGRREAIRSLGSSIFYLLGSIWNKRIDEVRDSVPVYSTRSKALFEKFIKLASTSHREEKNTAYYADQLCLSSKYLSRLIKEVSGRSVPEWIDSFTLLEAKNLLRYSNLGIKEISYTLNFKSVPAFHKFFKKHTGLTPTEYRNG